MEKELNRRQFLKIAGATAFAVSVSGVLSGCEEAPASASRPGSASSSGSSSKADSKPSSSSSASSDSSSSSASSEIKPAKIVWTISTNGDGTATLVGYDPAGAIPSGEVTLPTKVSGNVITEVDCHLGNKVTKLIIPGTIKKVYGIAYRNLNLREVIIQEGVEQLGGESYSSANYSFRDCRNLSKVLLPKSLKTIRMECFCNCVSLKSIVLSEGLKEIGNGAFANSGLTSVVVPSTVTELSYGAFSGAELKEVTIKCGKDGWGSFGAGNSVFAYCDKLEKVTLNEQTNYIAYKMFKGCTSLKTITLPKNVESIEGGAFEGCSNLKQIVIPENVTGIGGEAFKGCTALQKVNILGLITKISGNTFQNCTALRSIFIPMAVNEIEYGAFDGCSNLQDVYYPLNESAWANIKINGSGNAFLTAAELHTNALPMII